MDIGCKVACVNSADSRKLSNGLAYTIDDTRIDISGALELHFEELDGRNWYRADRFNAVNTNINTKIGGNTMNPTIRRVFTKDSLETAEKVQAHFGHEIADSFTGELNLRTNKDAYLAEIERRDKEQADKAHKAMGGDVAEAFAKLAGKASK